MPKRVPKLEPQKITLLEAQKRHRVPKLEAENGHPVQRHIPSTPPPPQVWEY